MADRLELRTTRVMPIALAAAAIILGLAFDATYGRTGDAIAAALAIAWIALAVRLARRRLIVDDRGVTARGAIMTVALRWDRIARCTLRDTPVAVGVGIHGMLVELIERVATEAPDRQFTLLLVAADGRELVIDRRYRGCAAARDRILAELAARGVAASA